MSLQPFPFTLFAPAGSVVDAPPAGASLWLRASSLGLADGATISGAWQDQSGSGNHATAAGAPVYRAAGINGQPAVDCGGVGYWSLPAILPTGDYTFFGITQVPAFNNTGQTVGGGAGGTTLRIDSSGVARLFHEGVGFNGSTVLSTNAPVSLCATFGATDRVARLYALGGFDGSTTFASALSITTTYAGAYNPTGGGTISNGRLAEVLIYPRRLSGDELLQLHVYANSRYGMVPGRNRVVMTEGGSWTYGLGVAGAGTTGGDTYQRFAFEATNFAITGYNSGVSGETVAQMTTAGPTLDRSFDACAPRNVLVFWGGSNDIESGVNATTVHTRIRDYCLARRAVGWRVLLLPIIDRVAANQAFFDTERATLTTLITANWPQYADGFVDLTTNANLGPVGARTNATYYQVDNIHLTPAANALVGQLVAPILNALLS